jgi:hypothetical protein
MADRYELINRQLRLSRAESIIRREPRLSIKDVNERLRDTFGIGLSSSALSQTKRAIYRETPTIIPERILSKPYIKSVFGSQAAYQRSVRQEIERRPVPIEQLMREYRRPIRTPEYREQRLLRTRDIIRNNPGLNKEQINTTLKNIFGVGIRHSDILKTRRDIFKESPKIIPAKSLNRRSVKALFGSQPGQRFDKLVKSAIWTRKEALSLSQLPLSRLTYFEDMVKDRQGLINQMKFLKRENHWTKAEYERHLNEAILAEYKERGWQSKKGENEIFRAVDDFRQGAIDEGKDPSPGKGRQIIRNPDGTLRFLRNKGNKAGQNQRYRELYPDRIREQKQNYRRRVALRGR